MNAGTVRNGERAVHRFARGGRTAKATALLETTYEGTSEAPRQEHEVVLLLNFVDELQVIAISFISWGLLMQCLREIARHSRRTSWLSPGILMIAEQKSRRLENDRRRHVCLGWAAVTGMLAIVLLELTSRAVGEGVKRVHVGFIFKRKCAAED